MNSWIERQIIFPKIDEHYRHQQRVKEVDDIRTSIIKELRRKKNSSLYNLKGEVEEPIAREKTMRKGKNTAKKRNKKCVSYFQDGGSQSVEDISGKCVKLINITEVMQEQKELFHSSPLKDMLRKLKFQKLQSHCPDEKNADPAMTQKRLRRRYLKSKLVKARTQAQEEIAPQVEEPRLEKDCLKIKQVTKFDYLQLARSLQAEKEAKRQQAARLRLQKPVKDSFLQITSIKGWNSGCSDQDYPF